jgi:hypothetical protein
VNDEKPAKTIKAPELPRKTTAGAWVHYRLDTIVDEAGTQPIAIRIDAEEIDSRRAAMASDWHRSDVVFVAWGQSIEDALKESK